jgi:hypothetical protein
VVKATMINIFVTYGALFILLPALEAGTAPHHNPINNSLIKAIIKIESSGNPKAISREGAWGLMQVRHAVWEKELKSAGIIRHKAELFNPEKNIRAGKYILTKYYSQTGCLEKTLMKYSGKAKKYSRKVMVLYQRQMEIDRRRPLLPHGSVNLVFGCTGMENRRQFEADDYCINALQTYRPSVMR